MKEHAAKHGQPPRIVRLLLPRRQPGDRERDIEADLGELFCIRQSERGRVHATARYIRDAISLWRPRRRLNGSPEPRRPRLRLTGLTDDLRFALRLFRRQWGVVAVAVGGLALAIGATTAVFSMINAIQLRPVGVTDPSTVVRVIRMVRPNQASSWAYSDYLQLRDGATLLRPEAWYRDGASLSEAVSDDRRESVSLVFVSGTFFETFAGGAAHGRALAATDDLASASPVVVLNHAYWQSRLGGDPRIVGRTVFVAGKPVTVVGIAQRAFTGPFDRENPPALWMTLSAAHGIRDYLGPFNPASPKPVSVAGRLMPSTSVPMAEAEASAIARNISLGKGESQVSQTVTARLDRLGAFSAEALVITGVIAAILGLLVLLACTNVANLLLASATNRHQEIGARLALGATRARVVRQLLTESLLLGLLSGALGLAIALLLLPLARMFDIPPTFDLAPDYRVYAFVVVMSILAGLAAGLAPARHGTGGDLLTPLKGGGMQASASPRSRRLRTTFVGIQAAASVILLVLSMLLVRALLQTSRMDVGFDLDRLAVVSVGFARDDSATRRVEYWTQALERMRMVPGIQDAALVYPPPFSDAIHPVGSDARGHRIMQVWTSAEYFRTAGITLLRGRIYTADEVKSRAPVAVITASLTRDFFGGEDPINSLLDRVVAKAGRASDGAGTLRVIGVVNDVRTARLIEPGTGVIYRPVTSNQQLADAVVRASAGPASTFLPLEQALRPLGVPVTVSRLSDGYQEHQVEPARRLVSIAAAIGAFALVLAIIGLFGVTAFVVGQRTREIGIRMAVGATRGDVGRLIVRDAMRPVLIGLIAGVGLALLGTRAIAATLYGGVSPRDPLAFVSAVVVLLATACVATAIPARRAARIDPAVTLREP